MVLVVQAIWRRHKVNSLLEMLLVRRGIELLLAICVIQVYTLDLHCSSMMMMLLLVIICDNLTIFFLIIIVDEIGRLRHTLHQNAIMEVVVWGHQVIVVVVIVAIHAVA